MFVYGLDHCGDAQRSHGRRCQGLHFHSGDAPCLDGGADGDGVQAKVEIDRHLGQRERMAQRNQVRGLLGGHDACHARNGQGIPLGEAAGAQEPHHLLCGPDRSGGRGLAGCFCLGGNIHHLGAAVLAQVRQRGGLFCVHSIHTSTSSPAASSVTPTGTWTRQFDPASACIRCEPSPPSSCTVPSRCRLPRRTWCLCPGDSKGWARRPRSGCLAAGDPSSPDRAGRRNISKDTRQLTGLPGNPRKGTPSNSPIPWGPPGCMATCRNSAGWSAMAWRTTSYAPLLTPPVVTIRSTSWPAVRSRAWSSAGLSVEMPVRRTLSPACFMAASRRVPLES